MPELNYVVLLPGVPKKMHFTDHAEPETIQKDPILGISIPKRKLVFVVDAEDGRPTNKIYSTMRSKEWAFWQPFLGDKSYRDYTWELTLSGQSFAAEVKITAISGIPPVAV